MTDGLKQVRLSGPVGGLPAVACAIVVVVAAKLAEDLPVPMVLALSVGVVVSPMTNAAQRLGLPRVTGALAVLLLTLLMLGGIAVLLEPVIRNLMASSSLIWWQLRNTVAWVTDLLQGIDEVVREVQAQMVPGPQGDAGSSGAFAAPSSAEALLYLPAFAAQFLVFLGTLFFFILERHAIYADMVGAGARPCAPV